MGLSNLKGSLRGSLTGSVRDLKGFLGFRVYLEDPGT